MPKTFPLLLMLGLLGGCPGLADAQAADMAVYAVVHVDIAPPPPTPGATPQDFAKAFADASARGKALLLQLAEGCTAKAGCLRFDVLLQTGTQNHFTLVEVWTDQGALDAFEASDTTREVRAKLAPLLGGPLDERLDTALR